MEQIIAGVSGTLLPYLFKKMGMKIGMDGVKYYAEVHKTDLNCYIHTAFMPFTIYGILLWVPALIKLSKSNANKFQRIVYMAWIIHYSQINKRIALIVSLFYLLPLIYAIKDYNRDTSLKRGLKISFSSLFIQEFVGHYISGDPPSRIEAIPNAILYSMMFSCGYFSN